MSQVGRRGVHVRTCARACEVLGTTGTRYVDDSTLYCMHACRIDIARGALPRAVAHRFATCIQDSHGPTPQVARPLRFCSNCTITVQCTSRTTAKKYKINYVGERSIGLIRIRKTHPSTTLIR